MIDDLLEEIIVEAMPWELLEVEVFDQWMHHFSLTYTTHVVEACVEMMAGTAKHLEGTANFSPLLKDTNIEPLLGQCIAASQAAEARTYDNDIV